MAYYLHIQSDEPIVTSNEYVNIFLRECTTEAEGTQSVRTTPRSRTDIQDYVVPHLQGEPLPRDPDNIGHHVIHPRIHKHYLLANRFVVTKDLLRQLHDAGDKWRTNRRIAGQYAALIIYPNEPRYWRELLKDILLQPKRYPTPNNMDKLLFGLCWHKAHFFQHDLHARPPTSAPRTEGMPINTERTANMARLTTINRSIITHKNVFYTGAHYKALWSITLNKARQSL